MARYVRLLTIVSLSVWQGTGGLKPKMYSEKRREKRKRLKEKTTKSNQA